MPQNERGVWGRGGEKERERQEKREKEKEKEGEEQLYRLGEGRNGL